MTRHERTIYLLTSHNSVRKILECLTQDLFKLLHNIISVGMHRLIYRRNSKTLALSKHDEAN